MLETIPHTNYRLNPCIHRQSNSTCEHYRPKQRTGTKRVAFTKEGLYIPFRKTLIRSNGESKMQAKRNSKKRSHDQMTPQPKEKIQIIGSSCTWNASELEHFKITLRTDVNVYEMIPERFFNFDHFEDYKDCIYILDLR